MRNNLKSKSVISKLLCFLIATVTLMSLIGVTAFSASQEKSKTLSMKYDDYLTTVDYDKAVIVNAGTPKSYKVGYGVKSGTKDDSVVKIENGLIHATGTGTAKVKLDGVEYTVKVEPAPISMFLLIGQSNMYGTEGNAKQSVANENGTVYSTFCKAGDLTVENAPEFVCSALTGKKASVNTVGTTANLSSSPVNLLTESGSGKRGMDSALAYEWHKLTGDKVWIVNTSRGSTSIKKWVKGAEQYNETVAVFKAAQQVMKKEILAGHYVLKNYGYFWCQGCTDRPNSAEYYLDSFLSMHENLKKDLKFDINADGKNDVLNFCNIIMPRTGRQDYEGYRHGVHTDETDAPYYESFLDLEMNGPRVAQYWLVNNPEYKDINLVCNIGDSWVTMPDGSDSVKEYFASKYENGQIDYPVQVTQKKSWYTPTTPADVHDSIHYNQIGFNEVGFEAARNTAYITGRVDKPEDVETTVTFYDWTGYRKINSIDACSWADSSTLVVPVVYPVYESKNVTYTFSKNLSYELYDLTAKSGTKGGRLTSVGASVNKSVKVIGESEYAKGEAAYYFEGTKTGLVNVAKTNYSENSVTIVKGTNGIGTVENGVHNNVIYQLDKTVNLLSTNEWVVEWTGKTSSLSSVEQSFMLLAERRRINNPSTSDINYLWHRFMPEKRYYITLGKSKLRSGGYLNSKVSLKTNSAEYHTYRIWNEVDSKGSNRIYLSVDGKYVGEYKDISGWDFTFKYIGSSGYEINNYQFKSLRIVEKSNCKLYGHEMHTRSLKATCTTVGILSDGCLFCNKGSRTELAKLGHKLQSKYTSDGNATYLSDGTKSRKCTRCSYAYTVKDPGTKLVLSKPKNVTAVPGSRTVTLSCSACKDAAGYKVYMMVDGKWKSVKIVRSSTTYTVSGLSPSTEYTFAVKAYTYVDNTCVWAPKYASIKTETAPEAPAVRVASTATGRATLAWGDVKGESGYQVWYSTSKNSGYKKVGNYKANTVKIYKSGLKSGKTYYFKVRAYTKTSDGYVYGDYSSVKSVKIK